MLGRLDDAEKCLQVAVKADSTNVWYQDMLANIYMSKGEGEKSSEIYLSLMEKDPGKYTNAYTLTLLGNKNLMEYKDSLALDNFEKALLYSPEYVPAILGKSEVYRMQGNIPAFFASLDDMAANRQPSATTSTRYSSTSTTTSTACGERNWIRW